MTTRRVSYGSLSPAVIGGLNLVVRKLFEKSARGESPVTVKKVSDVIEFSDSGIWGDESLDPNVDPRVFRVSDFAGDFRLDYKSAPTRSIPEDKLKKYELRKGDILVVKASGSANQVVSGRVAVFEGDDKSRYVPSNFLLRLRPKSQIDPHYLAFVLGSPPIREAVANSVKTMTYPNLSFRIYSEMEVPLIPQQDQRTVTAFFNALLTNQLLPELPPYLAEQRRIVARIDELAAEIHEVYTLRQEALKETEVLAGVFLKSVFDSGLTTGAWPSRLLPEIAEVARGKFGHRPRNEPRFYGGNIPFIQIGDISNAKRYIRSYSQTLNKQGLAISRLFPVGTVVIAITGATIGVTGILTFDSCFPDSIVGIQAKPEFATPEFIYFAVEYVKSAALAEATQTTQPNINLSNLERLRVPVPSISEQCRIVAQLNALQGEVDALRHMQAQTAAEINALLPSILDKAFKGEL